MKHSRWESASETLDLDANAMRVKMLFETINCEVSGVDSDTRLLVEPAPVLEMRVRTELGPSTRKKWQSRCNSGLTSSFDRLPQTTREKQL